ncbi:hypothetical protein GW17_00030142 [Ensete ventricosum]|nr:hypothetical protein GW17_00030142 [Ensete ventricosum]
MRCVLESWRGKVLVEDDTLSRPTRAISSRCAGSFSFIPPTTSAPFSYFLCRPLTMSNPSVGEKGMVCVTGAAGFVGSWLVMRLLEHGYTVKATVRDPSNASRRSSSLPNEVIKPTINGMMNVLESCAKAGTVRRVVFTSSAGTTGVHARRKEEYDENSWSDVEFCRAKKMTGWFVHLDDLCMAHIFLFEHPQAKGRYVCSSHDITISDLAKMLTERYPEYDIPTDLEDMFDGAIESCREKGLLPLTTKKEQVNGDNYILPRE